MDLLRELLAPSEGARWEAYPSFAEFGVVDDLWLLLKKNSEWQLVCATGRRSLHVGRASEITTDRTILRGRFQ